MTSRPSQSIYADTLAVFDQNEFEPLTTPEIADALDAKRRTVYQRLRKLVDRGELNTKETGANSRVWWRPPADSSPAQTTCSEIDFERERESDRASKWPRIRFDEAPDGIVVHNVDGTILDVNETLVEMIGYTRESLLSMDVTDIEVGIEKNTIQERWESLESGTMQKIEVEGTHRRKDGSTYPVEVWVSRVTTDEKEQDQFVALVRDITERKEHEQKRRETTQQIQGILATIEAAVFLKDSDGRYLRMNQNCRDILGVEDEKDVVGMTDDDLFPEDIAVQFRADDKRVLEAEETIKVEEEVPTTDGTRTFLTRKTPIGGEEGEPYAVCAVATDIAERKERERELERQREQLEALNHLNEVVSGITEAVINQSSREEIEQVVCEQLVEFDSYQFAWTCAVNSDMHLERKRIASIDGRHGELLPCCTPDTQTGQDPTTKSVRTQEMQILQHVLDDPDLESYHESARKYGYRSLALVPVVHEDTLYGVIGLTSERTDAFTEVEREVLSRLGEIVGHAIAAVERKRALLSDDVVELSFRMHNVEELGFPDASSGRVVFDRILPLGDGSYLEYGIATGDMMETVRGLIDADRTPHSGPVNVIETSGDETRFELRLEQPPFLPAIVDSGGYIDEARIEDGEYSILVHLPPSADVRHIVDAVADAFPAAEMVAQRQTTRSIQTSQRIMQTLAERLTDRQQVALEAAYFGGFFEWPRDRSGEEVADSLGITASTFHQHLRKAEKKLHDAVFTEA